MEAEKEETLATPGVLDKYQAAGKIANTVLQAVLKECVVGKQVIDLCRLGDRLIETEVDKVYNKKRMDKGIGFPTCVSPNHICGHLSPLPEDKVVIQEGDLVKVTLGVQIDGFIAMAAHSVVVNSDPAKVNEGKKADVVVGAYKALQAALRLLRPGNKNSQVTEVFEQVAADFEVSGVDGVLSHEVKKYLIDNSVCIGIKDSFEQRVEEHEFQLNEVFVLDVIFSSGTGKTKEADLRCTVYKRCLERNYILKTKQGRAFFGELEMRFPALPFTIRAFEDEITTKMGIKECLEKELVVGYPVMAEKPGEVVAQFSYTVALLKSQTLVLAGLPLEEGKFKSGHEVKQPKVVQLLAAPVQKKKKA